MLRIAHHWLLPVASAILWWAMLIALLVCWAAQGFPIYSFITDPEKHILYISDIAATNLQGIFIAGSASQGLFFVLGLCSERLLRHRGRLQRNMRRREKFFSGSAIAMAIIGELGILFVSIFNTVVYPTVHTSMLVVFIAFLGISSGCSILEYFFLDRNYKDYPALAWSLRLKALWFVVEISIAIAFGVTHNTHVNASAVLEWCISFIYPFYSLIVAYDLYPAHNKERGFYNNAYPALKDEETTYQTSDEINENKF